MTLEFIRETLREHGVVGAGGAGFPTYAKLNAGVDTIILNGVECEPLFEAHQRLLIRHAVEMLTAIRRIGDALQIKKAIVAVKTKQIEIVKSVQAALTAFQKIYLQLLPDIYPMGDEVMLVYEATGRIIPPGKLPQAAGVLVLNQDPVFLLNGIMRGSPASADTVITKTTNATIVLPKKQSLDAQARRKSSRAAQTRHVVLLFLSKVYGLVPARAFGIPHRSASVYGCGNKRSNRRYVSL